MIEEGTLCAFFFALREELPPLIRFMGGKDGYDDMEYSNAHRLAQDIRQSEEYQTYHGLQDEVMADETTAALIREYKKLQVKLQMGAVAGTKPDDADMQRFQGITALLFGNPTVSRYMLAEMRLQQALADIFKIVTDAAGIDMGIPGLDS